MIGHKWEPAESTIINSHSEMMEVPGRHGMHSVAVYDIEVRASDGTTGPARVPSAEHQSLRPGTIVRLEISAKTGEIRLHPHEGQLIIGFSTRAGLTDDDFAAPAGGTPSAAGLAAANAAGLDFAQLFGGGLPASPQVHMMGGAEAAEILRTVLSGDPAEQSAARDRLRHMKDEIVGHGHAGERSPAARLALLQEMADQGQLSQAEFDGKRQQILDEI